MTKARSRKLQRGLPPGSFVYTGTKHHMDVEITYMTYNETVFETEVYNHSNSLVVHGNEPNVLQWYDVRGLHDQTLIQVLADAFKVHPLAVENAVDVNQRPIYQEFEQGHFISLKHLGVSADGTVIRQAVALYFGQGFVITFQELEDDILEPLRHRIKHSSGRIRKRGADYLAYAIVDVIIDDYFEVLEKLEERVEGLEDRLFKDKQVMDKTSFYEVRKELLKVRKAVMPLREAVGQFYRSEAPLIETSTRTFLRDIYDHTVQIADSVDAVRDVLSGLQDLYISEVSLEMNRVMQFLTIITAIFVPLSFLTGLYGMNFVNMPELQSPIGYFVLLAVMGVLVLSILWWLRKRGWL